ncbi:MAG TPA: DUF6113 family protein [Trebonia sp.]|nr:DUF6113 family protein [Trebonia sp.]
MEPKQDDKQPDGKRPGGKANSRAYGAVVYLVLLILGIVEGMVGSFQYGQSPLPLFAVLLVVLVLASCLLAGWGTGSVGGAIAVAAGWVLASFFLSMGTHQGSVIITATAAGEWYLYGGTLAVFVGVLASFVLHARSRARAASGASRAGGRG